MIRKDLNFCDQILQPVHILDKTLKIFILIFFNFSSSFFQNIFRCNIPFGCGFSTKPNLWNSFKYLKGYSGSKNQCSELKKSCFKYFLDREKYREEGTTQHFWKMIHDLATLSTLSEEIKNKRDFDTTNKNISYNTLRIFDFNDLRV